jgi:hypothetical protein
MNDIFGDMGQGIGATFYADDGACWKRGRNIPYVIEKMQGAFVAVVEWSL